MITNYNATKEAPNGEYIDIKKYVGVGSISVLAVNPDNNTLRKYGWSIPEDADEPVYVTTNQEGKKSARIRFLVQIQDLDEKPIVPLDFWISPDLQITQAGDKCKIIDSFGRTAYATKEELKSKSIPQYANGPASISKNYKACHRGEEELVTFLRKYLNVTPFQMIVNGKWVLSNTPGELTIDNWGALCTGDVTEIETYLSFQPDNKVKVIFGVRNTEDNKSYQTFIKDYFIGNGSTVDRSTGEYAAARKQIDKLDERYPDSNDVYSALPIRQYEITASTVSDNSGIQGDFSF